MKKIIIFILTLFACVTIAPKVVALEPQVKMERQVEEYIAQSSSSSGPSVSSSDLRIAWFEKIQLFFMRLFTWRW